MLCVTIKLNVSKRRSNQSHTYVNPHKTKQKRCRKLPFDLEILHFDLFLRTLTFQVEEDKLWLWAGPGRDCGQWGLQVPCRSHCCRSDKGRLFQHSFVPPFVLPLGARFQTARMAASCQVTPSPQWLDSKVAKSKAESRRVGEGVVPLVFGPGELGPQHGGKGTPG